MQGDDGEGDDGEDEDDEEEEEAAGYIVPKVEGENTGLKRKELVIIGDGEVRFMESEEEGFDKIELGEADGENYKEWQVGEEDYYQEEDEDFEYEDW